MTIKERRTFMSNNNRITNKINNRKIFYCLTNNESSEPKENIENQILTDTEASTPKKDSILDILAKPKELSNVRAEIKNPTRSKI